MRIPEPALHAPETNANMILMNPTHIKPPISGELLDQIDLRVGTIFSVTDVPTSL
jgi:hypothetical protein